MAVELTQNALSAAQATGKTPVIVLKFDGLDTLFGPVTIKKYIRIGDPDLFIGDDWVIGGTNDVEDQKPYVQLSFSTSAIRQQIEPDRGSGSSISNMKIRLIDYRQEITELITPGLTFTEPLGLRGTVYFGFQETAWPEDYIVAFKGIVEGIDAGPGWVEFSFNHPDELKRVTIFDQHETTLNGAINNSTTTILLDDASGLVEPSDVLRSFVKIDDEFLEFTGISGNNLTGVTRGALLATDPRALAASHSDEASVESFYILEDNVVDLALKLMLSNAEADYASALAIESLGATASNEVFFQGQYLIRDYNITAGDFFTSSGCINTGNNQTDLVIESIEETGDGTIISFNFTFIPETSSTGLASVSSRYNILPVGAGMLPVDVDIDRHEYLKETYLGGVTVRHYIDEDLKLKDFLDQDLYNSVGLFSLPREAKASVGIHIPPLPIDEIVVLNEDNIKNPSNIVVKRAINKNFQNAIVYKIDRDLYEEKYRKGVITTNVQSIDEVGKRKDYVVESGGLRSTLQGQTLATSFSNRRLERYNRGSEFITGMKLTLKDGMRLEPGDIVIFDPENLKVVNTIDGDRERPAQFWEVVNREFNLKGEVTVDLVQTNYQSTNRYGLISPASKIDSATTTELVIKESYQSGLGANEYQKWSNFIGAQIRVRNASFTVTGLTTITAINANVITVSPALSFTPLSDYVMEFAGYDEQALDLVKLTYVHLTDDDNPFADGGEPYRII
jgi:hypothetical protein